jgi:hypothetical protein
MTRYELVKEQMQAWGASIQDERDLSLALLTPGDPRRAFVDPDAWADDFAEYEPDITPLQVTLQLAGEALQLLTAAEEQQPGQATALWLVTATPVIEDPAAVEALQQLAVDQGVRISIWLVDAPSRLDSEAALALRNLALNTGGAFFAFSGSEAFPDPVTYFDPQGRAYLFQYSSQLRTGGEHSIVLQLADEEDSASTEPFTLSLEIEPPNPILVSPPSQIERGPAEEDPQALAPFNQPLEIIVEFPDGIERELVRTTLFVNGERAGENQTAPFNRFVWGLSQYTTSERVFIQVEAEDELGLVGTSAELPVEISVQAPASSLRNFVARNAGLITLSVAVLAGGAVLATLVLSGRIAPPPLLTQHSRRSRPQVEETDPLLQSPLGGDEIGYNRFDDEAVTPPVPLAAPLSIWAYLQPIPTDEAPVTQSFIPLRSPEVLLGSDPASGVLIDDQSVQAQHAKLRHLEDGDCELVDLGSEAGTWLNYAPVSPEGSQVQDGDLVHIGRVPFRFRLNR